MERIKSDYAKQSQKYTKAMTRFRDDDSDEDEMMSSPDVSSNWVKLIIKSVETPLPLSHAQAFFLSWSF